MPTYNIEVDETDETGQTDFRTHFIVRGTQKIMDTGSTNRVDFVSGGGADHCPGREECDDWNTVMHRCESCLHYGYDDTPELPCTRSSASEFMNRTYTCPVPDPPQDQVFPDGRSIVGMQPRVATPRSIGWPSRARHPAWPPEEMVPYRVHMKHNAADSKICSGKDLKRCSFGHGRGPVAFDIGDVRVDRNTGTFWAAVAGSQHASDRHNPPMLDIGAPCSTNNLIGFDSIRYLEFTTEGVRYKLWDDSNLPDYVNKLRGLCCLQENKPTMYLCPPAEDKDAV